MSANQGRVKLDGAELRRLLALMLPLYVANLMYVGMGVIDTIVAGRAGDVDLAGVALGSATAMPMIIALGAVLTIVGPMVSRFRGAGQFQNIGLVLNNAKILACFLIAAALVCIWAASFIFPFITDDPALAGVARDYMYMLMLGVPAQIMVRVVQGHFEGFGQTRPALVLSVLSLLCNIPLNYLFVFGWGPIPAMGGAGCGLATAMIQWLNFSGLLGMMRFSSTHARYCRQLLAMRAPVGALCRRIFSLGLPMGIATLCEMSFFTVVTMVIAPLGTVAVSSQQVAINVSGLIFMFPFSMGIAASIRGAFHIGARNRKAFDAMVRTVYVFMFSIVLVIMLGTIFLREPIVSLYTDSEEIVALASTLLVYCAAYQIPDAQQALVGGLLRGCHDTKIITWVNLINYWLVGFPLACILIRTDWIVPAMGPAGAWVCFIITLTLTAVALSWRFSRTRARVFCR